MTKRPAYNPPAHLRPETAKWFAEVIRDFDLESHHVRVLTLAAESWDRCAEAREVLGREGLTYLDRFGAPRGRPEIAVERDSRLAFVRCLRELALDITEPEAPRPPTISR
jgi:phage terminase small subunit